MGAMMHYRVLAWGTGRCAEWPLDAAVSTDGSYAVDRVLVPAKRLALQWLCRGDYVRYLALRADAAAVASKLGLYERATVGLVRSAMADRSGVGHVVVPAIAGGIPETALGSRFGCGGGVVATNHAVWRSLAAALAPDLDTLARGRPARGRAAGHRADRPRLDHLGCAEVCGVRQDRLDRRARSLPTPGGEGFLTDLTDADLLSIALTGHGSSRAAAVGLLEALANPCHEVQRLLAMADDWRSD